MAARRLSPALATLSVVLLSSCQQIGDATTWTIDKASLPLLTALHAYEGVVLTGFGVVTAEPEAVARGIGLLGGAAVDVATAPVYALAEPFVDKDTPRHIYGNWCGPSVPPRDRTEDPEPIDDLDELCRRHDRCYWRADEGKTTTMNCDQTFATRLRMEALNFNPEQHAALAVIRAYYGLLSGLLP